jgi:formylglycine-generating enzyme required for sulfatase activity
MTRRSVGRLLLLLLPALAALLLPAWGQAAKGKKYALLVGVKDYRHAGLRPLKYTENDVEDLAKILRARGAGFAKVHVLTNTRGARDKGVSAPTAANIRAALEGLLRARGTHDTVLVALSGHGVQLKVKDRRGETRTKGFFCPTDADLFDEVIDEAKLGRTSLLSLDWLFARLKRSGAGVKLVLMDACRDELAGDKSPLDAETLPRPPRGTAALFSCSPGQKSHEIPKLRHGVFFHFVLEGLRGRAKVEDEVTWDDLARYVKRQVNRESPKLIGGGGRQTPHEIKDIVGESPVLLAVNNEPAKRITNSIGMRLVLIPAGKFTMGSPAGEKDRGKDEEQHDVEITRAFYLGVTEVTQGQFKRVMGYNPSYFSKDGKGKEGLSYFAFSKPGGGKEKVKDMASTDDLPVENVSWEEAQTFLKKLSDRPDEKKKGRTYRLPTEAEWEYSCRGGAPSRHPFHFGPSLSTTQANFNSTLGRTCAVGSYPANRFGLHDMHGNVWEWCSDWYDKDYYGKSPPRDPRGPSRGSSRVDRGGGWRDYGRDCRSADRRSFGPAYRDYYLGFRVALVPSGE